MWAATDNLGDISWHQAEKWIRFTFPLSLPVQFENWRLPTLDELKSLHITDKGYSGYESNCGQHLKITPEIQTQLRFYLERRPARYFSCTCLTLIAAPFTATG